MSSFEWTGLIGVAFAALLASLGYIYQLRVQHKKSLKKVLYFLLEIRYSALAAVFDANQAADKYAEHFFSRCRAEGLASVGMDFPAALRQLIIAHFERGIALAKSDLEGRLLGQFEEALLDLAALHPTLAHRLLGRDRLEKLVGLTKSYGTNVAETAINDVHELWAREFLTGLTSKVQRIAFDEIILTLDSDVLELGRHCGYFEHRRCKRALKNANLRIDKEFFAEIDPMINDFFRTLREAATRGIQMPSSPPPIAPQSALK